MTIRLFIMTDVNENASFVLEDNYRHGHCNSFTICCQ